MTTATPTDAELSIKIEESAPENHPSNHGAGNGDDITNLSENMAVLMTSAGGAPSATTITEANRQRNSQQMSTSNSNMAVGDMQTTLTSLDHENQFLNEIS